MFKLAIHLLLVNDVTLLKQLSCQLWTNFSKVIYSPEYHKQLTFGMFSLFQKTFSCLEDFNLELKTKFSIAMLVLHRTNLMKENNEHYATLDSLSLFKGNDDLNNDLCNE